MAIKINNNIVERLSVEDRAELRRLLTKVEELVSKGKVLP